MSHILALQVGHFSMQNLDQYSVQINNDEPVRERVPESALKYLPCFFH